MQTSYESMAVTFVQAIVQQCARDGVNAPARLREVRNGHRTFQSLQASVYRAQGKALDPNASRYTRAIVEQIDCVLLELELPKAEA